MNIKTITYREYHQIANSFIRQVGFHLKTDLPLDIEQMIYVAGHHIVPITNLFREFSAKGVLIKKISGFDIGIDRNHWMDDNQDLFFRFTLAEELAHILIHAPIYNGLTTVAEVISFLNDLPDEEYKKLDQQARNVASYLLFPQNLLENFIINFCEENINQLKSEDFYSKESLAGYIAEKTYRKLFVSKQVIAQILIYRYPRLIIDIVLERFGLSLIK